MKSVLGTAVCLAALSLLARAAEPEQPVYKRVDGRELSLQLVKPADWRAEDRRPALVLFHGGGWTSGSSNQFAQQAAHFAARGMVGVLVQYRLLKKDTKDPPLVCVQDAKSAMRWVRRHASELGIDPRRIAAGGGSAGGHLAAFVGMVDGLDDPQDDLSVSPKANALILFNPVFDNGPDRGWGRDRIGDRYPEFSPAHNITPDDPPAIVLIGTQDKLIPVSVVERFKSNMERAGVRCDLRLYDGQGHGFFNSGHDANDRYFHETLRAADNFLVSLGWLPPAPPS